MKKGSCLPAETERFVAAGFASTALQQRDFDAARQRLSHIENPKTRKRIEAEIQSAEGG